jgi:hypothetical protein
MQYDAVLSGGGKSHLAAALGFALIENGRRVLFTRTTNLVQRRPIARRELARGSAGGACRAWPKEVGLGDRGFEQPILDEEKTSF